MRGLGRNLTSGLQLLALRRRVPADFVSSFDQVAGLLLLTLAAWAGLDTLHAESGAQLMLDGLYGWAFYLLLGLFACGLIARAYCRQAETRALLVPTLAVTPFLLAAFWLLSDLAVVQDRAGLFLTAMILYLIALSVRIMQAAYGTARPKALVLAILIVIAAPFLLASINIDTRLWLVDDTQDTAADDDSGTEATLYEQPGRIVTAVEQLPPRMIEHTNVYYVGFAGDGAQSIFKREALFGATALGEHFDSTDRSVELINDQDDRDSYPIASVSGLEQTLRLVADRMDLAQDVLVLLLSSHGSKDGLAVENGALPLMQLGPAELKHAVEESGIRWRIIVVSACYSGVFAEALRDPQTVVIMASDAEHSSFGCDDDRELTWFGEAFLKDSLAATPTLEAAFRKASELIAQRESAAHKTHSNPQMLMGPLMRAKLTQLEGGEHAQRHATIVANH